MEPLPQPTPEDADARVNDLKNQFIDAKQRVFYTAPQAFLRQQGSGAITDAEATQQTLTDLRQQMLDAAPLVGKQTMLRNLANGLTGGAVARLAPALAGQGPLADGYALALSTYAAKTPGQNTLADRILDGLDRMKAAGEGGRPVADTGSDWRQAFEQKTTGTVAALRTAAAALYTQSVALQGRNGARVDGDVLDEAIVAVTGRPAMIDSHASIAAGAVATDQPNVPETARSGFDGDQLAQLEISPHALGRMQLRGITAQQLQDAIDSPNKTLQPNGNTKCTAGGITVILSPTGRVVTCY